MWGFDFFCMLYVDIILIKNRIRNILKKKDKKKRWKIEKNGMNVWINKK